ncbi:hypothetical protein QYF36_026312 [Acer negundo]|nr:hypothetical protein QYF36_026312 [Acer negundo]
MNTCSLSLINCVVCLPRSNTWYVKYNRFGSFIFSSSLSSSLTLHSLSTFCPNFALQNTITSFRFSGGDN